MAYVPQHNHVAYRCPECGDMIYGLVSPVMLASGMLRLKCSCGKSALDVSKTNDGKIRISAPCVYCRQNHSYVLSDSIFFERDIFLLNCPYSNMDIAFVGEKEKIDEAAVENEKALRKIITDMDGETLADIQPTDMSDEEILPDAAVYDCIRFIVKDLEAEGAVDCPCHGGSYDLRYAPDGIQVYCTDCGATYTFKCATPTMAEEYLGTEKITLA